MYQTIVYTDILVKNLYSIAELSSQLHTYIQKIDKKNPKVIELAKTDKSDLLYYYVRLLNIHMSVKEVKKFSLGMNKPPETTKEQIVVNIRNMLDYINVSAYTERFGITVLIHLNKLFLDNVTDIWEVGKFINRQEEIDTTYDIEHIEKEIIFAPQANTFIKELEELYESEKQIDIIRIYRIFSSLVTHATFAHGNDAVALGIFLFLYKKSYYDIGINFYRCIYRALENTQKELVVTHDMFMELFFAEVVHELRDMKQKLSPFIEDVHAAEDNYVDINIRQVKGLHYLKEKGKISREIYAKLNSISQITAYRDLSNLLQKGYVRVEGIGKGTKYLLMQ